MIARRIRHILLIIFTLLIAALALYQMILRTQQQLSTRTITLLAMAVVLLLVWWVSAAKFQSYSTQTLIACVILLNALGITMIWRIDAVYHTGIAKNQLLWTCLAATLCIVLTATVKDYRIFRQFSYLSMILGLILLLSPLIPGVGRSIQGARTWIGIGSHTIQPSEFAKLLLAFFFASYLFDHRDQLAVGGKKILGIRLPRLKDLGPIIIVWAVSMGVLVLQHDLGTSLMFFAMFVSMLYVATGQKSWLAIGSLAFITGSAIAVKLFAHVGYRFDAWISPFDNAIYTRPYGSSSQLVSGLFGMASGGLLGNGLGQGKPQLTPLSNSDFIYTALSEELGLTGIMAILVIYLIIIGVGMTSAMRIRDGFGKLLASGLVFTMAFQVFVVVGGVTRVIPLTGLTLPYMAAGGSSLIANYLLAAILLIISHHAHKPEPEALSQTAQREAIDALYAKELEQRLEAKMSNPIEIAQNLEHGSEQEVNLE